MAQPVLRQVPQACAGRSAAGRMGSLAHTDNSLARKDYKLARTVYKLARTALHVCHFVFIFSINREKQIA